MCVVEFFFVLSKYDDNDDDYGGGGGKGKKKTKTKENKIKKKTVEKNQITIRIC